MVLDLDPQRFLWAGGIEDTFVPQARQGQRPLDEYELMGHYGHWREDLALARELGLRALRWGVPWYRVEPAPGRFDWSWTDQVVPYLAQELGVTPIVDLMHYGCPFWLEREFVNPGYPQAVANYAGEFARRYSTLVRWYTPLNEPHMNALMCGQRGVWPPYLRGERGYIRVMLQLVKGILATVSAIREVDQSALMVHVEATGLIETTVRALEGLAAEERLRRCLSYDLLTGRVTEGHPLFAWLLRNGVSLRDLELFAALPTALDVVGLNFYPQWSAHDLYLNRRGALAWRNREREGQGFSRLIETFYRRYEVPVMVTETSAHGADETRARWLEASVRAVRELRGRGVPVVGYTWFPLFTMIDWRYRFGARPAKDYLLELGLYRLDGKDGARRWRPTELVEQLKRYIGDPEGSIGIVGGA